MGAHPPTPAAPLPGPTQVPRCALGAPVGIAAGMPRACANARTARTCHRCSELPLRARRAFLRPRRPWGAWASII
eukprot:4936433-Pyramimonas_sp.AAC.1